MTSTEKHKVDGEEKNSALGYYTGVVDVMAHPYFDDVNWEDVAGYKLDPVWYKQDPDVLNYVKNALEKDPLTQKEQYDIWFGKDAKFDDWYFEKYDKVAREIKVLKAADFVIPELTDK